MTIRRTAAVLGFLSAGMLMVACGAEPGTPRAESTTPIAGSTSNSKSAAPTSTSEGSDALANMDPCTLLTTAEASEVGFSGPGSREDGAGQKGCQWVVSGSFGILISLNMRQGLETLNLSGKTPIPITPGKHSAIKLPEGSAGTVADSGSCDVHIGVSSKSSVGVYVTTAGGKGTELACQRAEKVAKFVDVKLP